MNSIRPRHGWVAFRAVSLALFFCSVTPASAERDFLQYNRHPGPDLVPGVELYEVKQEGEAAPASYERRVVAWWPREGVHTYPERDDMPLRTWTLREPEDFDDLPERFEAHLIGFRVVLAPEEALRDLEEEGEESTGADSPITVTRELVIDQPYLHLPFDADAPGRSMRIYDGDQVVRRAQWQLAEGVPDFWLYTEVRDYMGRTLRVEVDELPPDSTALEALTLADTVPGQDEDLYEEAYRPQFHFTAARGWLNDPNGMVYYDGEYHLFFQHNPYSVNWGNMTWGHAVSEDMIHWRQQDAAIHPDELGAIWSGGGVVDFDNTTGWATDDHVPIIAFYTSAGQPFTQSMAYSTDRGRTMIKYENNPIIGNIEGSNRDPNVFWHEPSRQWIMSLWISSDRFDLFGSANMREWTPLSELEFPGGYECPDMFELPVDGDPDNTRWVFWEGAGKYLIGGFDGKVFEPESEVLHSTFGSNDYAAQTFTNMPEGDDRRVQISWMRGGNFPGMPFNQQMTVPRELTLRTTSEGIRLFIEPVEEIKTLRQAKHQWAGLTVGDDDITLDGVEGDLFDIEIEFDLGDAQAVGLKIRDRQIEYAVAGEQLTSLGDNARLPADDNRIRLRILVDRTSVEVFANDGRVQIATSFVPDENMRDIAVYATGGQAEVISLNVWELRSIYEQIEPFQHSNSR